MSMVEMWLPIGSVVLLEEGNKLVMIYGRAQRQIETDKEIMWDYVGCLFPEGNIGPEYNCLFSKEQIEKVYFVGFQSVEEYELAKQLDELLVNHKDLPQISAVKGEIVDG